MHEEKDLSQIEEDKEEAKNEETKKTEEPPTFISVKCGAKFTTFLDGNFSMGVRDATF